MAIVIQEEKRKVSWFGFGVLFLIITATFAIIYYLFFVKPSFIEKVAPSKLQSIKELSSIKFDPRAILDDSRFQILKKYVSPTEIGPAGKTNPFLK